MEAEDLVRLLLSLQNVQLERNRKDDVKWALESNMNFSTKSLYRFISPRGVRVKDAENIWKTKLPMKIKVFMWQLAHDKLQSAMALKTERLERKCSLFVMWEAGNNFSHLIQLFAS